MEESNDRVDRFVEKPKIFVGNKINVVIYLLNPSVLDRIELKPTSIKKEIFPQIASSKQLYAMVLPGFWMGIGQPKDYISGLRLYLDSLRKNASSNFGSFNDFFHGCIFFRSKLLYLCCGLSIVNLGGKTETPKGDLGELKPSSSPAAQTLLLVFNQELSLFCLLTIDLFPMVASLEKKQKTTKG